MRVRVKLVNTRADRVPFHYLCPLAPHRNLVILVALINLVKARAASPRRLLKSAAAPTHRRLHRRLHQDLAQHAGVRPDPPPPPLRRRPPWPAVSLRSVCAWVSGPARGDGAGVLLWCCCGGEGLPTARLGWAVVRPAWRPFCDSDGHVARMVLARGAPVVLA